MASKKCMPLNCALKKTCLLFSDFLKSDFLAPMPSSMTQSDLIVKTISNVSHKLFCMILCLKESVLACDFVIFEENEFKCQFGDLNAAVASPSQFDDGEIIVKTGNLLSFLGNTFNCFFITKLQLILLQIPLRSPSCTLYNQR